MPPTALHTPTPNPCETSERSLSRLALSVSAPNGPVTSRSQWADRPGIPDKMSTQQVKNVWLAPQNTLVSFADASSSSDKDQ